MLGSEVVESEKDFQFKQRVLLVRGESLMDHSLVGYGPRPLAHGRVTTQGKWPPGYAVLGFCTFKAWGGKRQQTLRRANEWRVALTMLAENLDGD